MKPFHSLPLWLMGLLLVGLLSGCSDYGVGPLGTGSYDLSLPEKSYSLAVPAEYSVDLIAGQMVSLSVSAMGSAHQARLEILDPQQQVFAAQTVTYASTQVYFPPMPVRTGGTYRLVATCLAGECSQISGVLYINGTIEKAVPSNTAATAQDLSDSLMELPGNGWQYHISHGEIDSIDDVDYFQFPLKAGQSALVKSRADGGYDDCLQVTLQTASGESLSSPVAPADGIYYLRVAFDPARFSYPIWYELALLIDSDFEQEPNNTPNSAQHMALSRPVLGFSGTQGNTPDENFLPYTYQTGPLFLTIGPTGVLAYVSIPAKDTSTGQGAYLFDSGARTRLVLHANGVDLDSAALGFYSGVPKLFLDDHSAETFQGQGGGIQVNRAYVADKILRVLYITTTLTNLTDVAIPDVILLDSYSPAPSGILPISANWIPNKGGPGGLLLGGNDSGWMGLFSPDENLTVAAAADYLATPAQVLNGPRFEPVQPGAYTLNAAANIGLLPAHGSSTSLQILVLDQTADWVSGQVATALDKRPILDDIYRVQHGPGIYQASLYLDRYGYSQTSESGPHVLSALYDHLQPVLTLSAADGQPIQTSRALVDGRVQLTYPVENAGDYLLTSGTDLPWVQDGGEYVLRVDPLLQIDRSPSAQIVCEGRTAQFSTTYSGPLPPQIQWQARPAGGEWTDLPNQTGPSLTIAATVDLTGSQYRALFRAQSVEVPSPAALLTVNSLPRFSTAPSSQVVRENQLVELHVSAGGPTDWQWQVSDDAGQTWTDLPGETSSNLAFSSRTSESGRRYRSVARNGCGVSYSQPAEITVLANRIPAISAGSNFSCLLHPDALVENTSRVDCWGDSLFDATTPPVDTHDFVQVDAGYSQVCGLRSDGSLACWGDPSFDMLTPPQPNSGFVQVSTGALHACALRQDGSIACWGLNDAGQSTPPAPNSGYKQVSAGAFYSCGLKTDGTVVCWGSNDSGQATPPTDHFTQISAGYNRACGLKPDGAVACWGWEEGDGDPALPTPNTGFIQLSDGSLAGCAIRSDHTLVCWGSAGKLKPPAPNQGFAMVSLGVNHACAVKLDGSALCWGQNDMGQAPPVALLPNALPAGLYGQPYTQHLTASGSPLAQSQYRFEVLEGPLPLGLSLSVDGTLSGTPAQAGSFPLVLRMLDEIDYTSTQTYTLVIRPAELVVTAQDLQRPYGAANPGLTYATTGFVNDDTNVVLTGAPFISTPADVTSPVGDYPITAALGSLAAQNYTFSFQPGILTVTPATPNVQVSFSRKTTSVGQPVTLTIQVISPTLSTPAGEITLAVGNRAPQTLTLQQGQVTLALTSLPVGDYPITVTYSGGPNFTPAASDPQTLTVQPMQLFLPLVRR